MPQAWQTGPEDLLGPGVALPLPPSLPRLIFGMMVSTAFLSMWLSNTASTAMMLPIASAILKNLFGEEEESTGEAGERAGPTPQVGEGVGTSQGLRAGKQKALVMCQVF